MRHATTKLKAKPLPRRMPHNDYLIGLALRDAPEIDEPALWAGEDSAADVSEDWDDSDSDAARWLSDHGVGPDEYGDH